MATHTGLATRFHSFTRARATAVAHVVGPARRAPAAALTDTGTCHTQMSSQEVRSRPWIRWVGLKDGFERRPHTVCGARGRFRPLRHLARGAGWLGAPARAPRTRRRENGRQPAHRMSRPADVCSRHAIDRKTVSFPVSPEKVESLDGPSLDKDQGCFREATCIAVPYPALGATRRRCGRRPTHACSMHTMIARHATVHAHLCIVLRRRHSRSLPA